MAFWEVATGCGMHGRLEGVVDDAVDDRVCGGRVEEEGGPVWEREIRRQDRAPSFVAAG